MLENEIIQLAEKLICISKIHAWFYNLKEINKSMTDPFFFINLDDSNN